MKTRHVEKVIRKTGGALDRAIESRLQSEQLCLGGFYTAVVSEGASMGGTRCWPGFLDPTHHVGSL